MCGCSQRPEDGVTSPQDTDNCELLDMDTGIQLQASPEHQALQTKVTIFHVSKKSIKHSKAQLSFSMSLYKEHQVLQTMVIIFHEFLWRASSTPKDSYHFPWVSKKSIKSYTIFVSRRTLSLTESHFPRANPLRSAVLWSWIADWIACIYLHFG